MLAPINVSLVKNYTYISIHDPAVDVNADGFAEEWKKYIDGTIQEPPLKQGQSPTVFTLKPITSASLIARLKGVNVASGSQSWAVATAAHCIVSIENFSDTDGVPFEPRLVNVSGFSSISEDDKDLIGEKILAELGGRLITRRSPS